MALHRELSNVGGTVDLYLNPKRWRGTANQVDTPHARAVAPIRIRCPHTLGSRLLLLLGPRLIQRLRFFPNRTHLPFVQPEQAEIALLQTPIDTTGDAQELAAI